MITRTLLALALLSSSWRPPGAPYEIGPTWVREAGRTASMRDGALASDFSGAPRTRVLTAPLDGYPALASGHPLLDALHRLALEEALQDVRPDGALMAGKEWTGVWTRDVAYSTHLALAWLLPAAARASLVAKVAEGRVRQDTGTGGAWPVSTDRVVWTLAAWELYLATGDRAWLARAHARAARMAHEDRAVAFDPHTGLMFGESSFMDWREQTYPPWMQPADIYATRALGTNVVHAASWRALAAMERALARPGHASLWDARAAALERAILRRFGAGRDRPLAALVHPDPHRTVSRQTEALGNALAVLTGVLDGASARAALAAYPLGAYGVPTIHPQLAHAPPYHNRSVWPFVQAYFALAAARAGLPAVFEHGLGAVVRAAALTLTNKENLVADTGRPEGTAINSDRQLWSVAGFLALVHRGLFGLRLDERGIGFAPVVPAALGGRMSLRGVRIRGAVLDLTVEGRGDRLVALAVDGRACDPARPVPYPAAGRHTVRMVVAPGNHLTARPRVLPPGPLPVEAAPAKPATSPPLTERPGPGAFLVRARYSNGAGPIHTGSRCGMRALLVDGVRAGVLVLPQRGAGAWREVGLSAPLCIELPAGTHTLTVARDPLAVNMDGRDESVVHGLVLEPVTARP